MLYLVLLTAVEARRDCFVDTRLGPVKGSTEKSRNGKPFCSFRGIPYAAPPIGELRFEAPQSLSPWSKVLNARHNGPVCIQKLLGLVVGREDCLYLNVYTPERPTDDRAKLPVIVYIHGGRYSVGSGVSYAAGPWYMLDKDVVLVTINYRLGVMGFLSTGDDVAPGNYAMKDQVAALRWVRDNIEQFGGDAERVTIQGQSAGSKSVHFHMFSPSSRGLFHRAISQSGSAFMPWVLPPADPLAKAKEQAEVVGCPATNSAALVRCLRGMEAKDIVKKELELWQPVLESKSASNPEPFLTLAPLQLVQTGEFYKVPWLMGSTSEDGAFFGARNITDHSEVEQFSEHMDVQGPEDFFLKLSLNESLIPETWQRIRSFYFGKKEIPDPSDLIKLYTDRYVVHAVHKAAILHSEAGHEPIYRYNFAYRGLYSFGDLAEIGSTHMNLGVVHMDDLIYLIPLPVFNVWPAGHPDKRVIDTMVTLFTNFATYGNPTPSGGKSEVKWLPFSVNNRSYMNIAHDMSQTPGFYGIRPVRLSMEHDLYKDRMEFWDSLPLKENADDFE